MTNRRQMIVGLMLTLGGPSLVAACDPGAGDDEILRAIRPDGRLVALNRREFRTVGVIADAIIPRTDTPGAIDANVPDYIDAMLAAWASDETRRTQRLSIKAIRARLRELGGNDLLALPNEQRLAAIAALDAESFAEGAGADPESVAARYRALKQLIVTVYYSTEIGATQELQYELVPGRWLADAPLSDIGRTWGLSIF